jgi:putative N6-adenine-specific DNA methylase
MHDFLIICPLNLERFTLLEIKEKWSFVSQRSLPELKTIQGGVLIEGQLEEVIPLNHLLKTANRILLRIKKRKCRDFPKLFQILSRFDWRRYLSTTDISFTISSKKSRLIHTTRIEQTAKKSLEKYLKNYPFPKDHQNHYQQNIYLHLEQDLLTISLDTTGQALYHRPTQYKGHAPIRASIASCLLIALRESIVSPSNYTLIDPMCGSGTFLVEDLNYSKPHHDRNYTYQYWPLKLKSIPSSKIIEKKYQSYLGFDYDQTIVKNIQHSNIIFKTKDIFDTQQLDSKNIVIINPPYGKKVKISGNILDFYNRILQASYDQYSPDKLLILTPGQIKWPYPKFKVFNGGIWLNCYLILNKDLATHNGPINKNVTS